MKEISMVICILDRDYTAREVLFWYKNSFLHRKNRPATIIFNTDETIEYAYYHKNNACKRFGPACVKNNRDGSNHYIQWLINNKLFIILDETITHRFYDDITHNYIAELEKFIKEKNIVFSRENNFEIPDEYKAEFKLTFM